MIDFQTPSQSLLTRVASASGVAVDVLKAVWPVHNFTGTLPADLLDVMVAEDQWVAKLDGRSVMQRPTIASLIDSTVLADALKD